MPIAEPSTLTRIRRSSLWLPVTAFLLFAVVVDPRWQGPWDDDWAYALTVRHLLETGSYELHPWSAASYAFQAYWGALFGWIAGFSHATLRLSTMVLWLSGILGFYLLAREHRFSGSQASLLSLVLVASPLALNLSFSFMTDIPYLACMVLALALYTRALRLHSAGGMLLGSVAACAAILTRQFGVVLIAGLGLLTAVDIERRKNLRLYLSGVFLPILASAGQYFYTQMHPTWGMEYVVIEQATYRSRPWLLAGNLFWRPAEMLHYVAVFLAPIILLAVIKWVRSEKRGAGWWLAGAYLYAVSAWAVGHFLLNAPGFFPFLPWIYFHFLRGIPTWLQAAATTFTFAGSIFVAFLLAAQYGSFRKWRELHNSEKLLDLVTLCTLALHILVYYIVDRYTLSLVPYVLIVAGRYCADLLKPFSRLLAVTCLGMGMAASLGTRRGLALNEVHEQGAMLARSKGVPAEMIGGYWRWAAFDSFGKEIKTYSKAYRIDEMTAYVKWGEWEERKNAMSEVLISASPTEGKVLGELEYRPYPFGIRRRTVYVVRRRPSDH